MQNHNINKNSLWVSSQTRIANYQFFDRPPACIFIPISVICGRDISYFLKERDLIRYFPKCHFPISVDEKATIDTIVFISVASRTAAPLYTNNKTINIHPDPCTMPQMLHHSKLYRLTLDESNTPRSRVLSLQSSRSIVGCITN